MNTTQRIMYLCSNGALCLDESRTIAGTTITRTRSAYIIEWPDGTETRLKYMAMNDEAHERALLRLRDTLLAGLVESVEAGAA